jgi:hypothetical protein
VIGSETVNFKKTARKDQKLPALQFYPGDWRRDVGVQSLSFHDRGVWFEMLMFMHQSERRGFLVLNGEAMSEDSIARAIGEDPARFRKTLATLLKTGVAGREEESGAIMNRRMARDEVLRQIRAEAGVMGGNPALVKQIRTMPDKQAATPSSSLSNSHSDPKAHDNVEVPVWLPKKEWEMYLEMRDALHAPLRGSALTLAIRKLERLKNGGSDPASVLEQSAMNGWKGLFVVRSEAKQEMPLQAGTHLTPEFIEARRRTVEEDELKSYWVWRSMSDRFKQENPRKPPLGWFDEWSPTESQC